MHTRIINFQPMNPRKNNCIALHFSIKRASALPFLQTSLLWNLKFRNFLVYRFDHQYFIDILHAHLQALFWDTQVFTRVKESWETRPYWSCQRDSTSPPPAAKTLKIFSHPYFSSDKYPAMWFQCRKHTSLYPCPTFQLALHVYTTAGQYNYS